MLIEPDFDPWYRQTPRQSKSGRTVWWYITRSTRSLSVRLLPSSISFARGYALAWCAPISEVPYPSTIVTPILASYAVISRPFVWDMIFLRSGKCFISP
ncbi:MAG: hypothetical protein U9Q37_00620 [Euryarchaeota archaeon]|nr:hypothetical protein [Euryarchaeota archaeon]